MNLTDIDLAIFDVDGTLCDRDSCLLYPAMVHHLEEIGKFPIKLAIATNQGGVGLRYWMESENFGEPNRFPTEDIVAHRITTVANTVAEITDKLCAVYISYAYLSKTSGKWGPTPPGKELDDRWSKEWRKPAPGMLRRAMKDAAVFPQRTLFFGDSKEDEQAAQAAGCHFIIAEWGQLIA